MKILEKISSFFGRYMALVVLTVAALALTVGDREDADALVGTIHENQRRFGALWDHWECGFRYTRPLSSWTTLTAASGLQVNAEKKTVRLQPVQASLTVPVATCAFLATAVFEGKTCTLAVREGSAESWTVEGPEGYQVTVEDLRRIDGSETHL